MARWQSSQSAERKYPKPYSGTCGKAMDEWFYEGLSFNFSTLRLFTDNVGKGMGHFTQVVWKGSVKMGCGTAMSDYTIRFLSGAVRIGGCKAVVCRYWPPGNIPTDAEFAANGTSGNMICRKFANAGRDSG
ncbi:hypothetical protein VOLCADRAFT_92588 [Volvox carteri f. nagariensis]|uniref:SCP domain-containing protein n=1 Tax=Volvox carteri f. nagariensis TaxID=3068 RepID=D8U016_VOLCA|nr:uncharacterized protein VOLCADRAFT_92588 [Volvox carteri f. nagariensis]EFJ46788.1 hypothetical protein VOLCADRAFT_92588 [Volvox carteri f. nagariensis]|eukprot:XP_002951997.1 hypothetical protein VOLCADRAFT_92588 [Volvox carteri f. nagariensis]